MADCLSHGRYVDTDLVRETCTGDIHKCKPGDIIGRLCLPRWQISGPRLASAHASLPGREPQPQNPGRSLQAQSLRLFTATERYPLGRCLLQWHAQLQTERPFCHSNDSGLAAGRIHQECHLLGALFAAPQLCSWRMPPTLCTAPPLKVALCSLCPAI